MCGLVGMIGPKLEAKHEDAIEDGLHVASLRGMDSVGVGIVPFDDTSMPFINKRLGSPPFRALIPFNGAKVLIGHVRSATIGGATNRDLAHPFGFDNIMGVHNGTLRGPWRRVLEDQTNERFGSDSQAIFYNFAYWGVRETIESIYGAWALIWWDNDEKTLNMVRNSERSLWLAKGESGTIYWASEHWMISAMLRQGEKDRDKLVKYKAGAKGAEARFFHRLPTNTWRRYKFNAHGQVVQLPDMKLEGAIEPKPEPVANFTVPTGNFHRNDAGNLVGNEQSRLPWHGNSGHDPKSHREWAGPLNSESLWADWHDGEWIEQDSKEKGGIRIDSKFLSRQTNSKGTLYRVLNGVAYVSKPGNPIGEITFRDLLEFHTSGKCACCGDFINHPNEIGYLGDDYNWMVCRPCVKDWFAELGHGPDLAWSTIQKMDDKQIGDDIITDAMEKAFLRAEDKYEAGIVADQVSESGNVTTADIEQANISAIAQIEDQLKTTHQGRAKLHLPPMEDASRTLKHDNDCGPVPNEVLDALPPALREKVKKGDKGILVN